VGTRLRDSQVLGDISGHGDVGARIAIDQLGYKGGFATL
jgi:hypothetical protein